jgi:hypothetical protein
MMGDERGNELGCSPYHSRGPLSRLPTRGGRKPSGASWVGCRLISGQLARRGCSGGQGPLTASLSPPQGVGDSRSRRARISMSARQWPAAGRPGERPPGAGHEHPARIAAGGEGARLKRSLLRIPAGSRYTSLAGGQERISLSAPQSDAPSPAPLFRFGILGRELPFLLMLLLSFAGIAYTTFAQESSVFYWKILVPIFAAICIVTGWHPAYDKREHWRLLWTQLLHWGAFLAAMQLMFMTGVQRVMNTTASGLSVLILLALGTFVAGVHAGTWQISAVGIVLALGVPAIAWVQQSALLVAVAILALTALVVGLWFVVHHRRAKFASPPVPPAPPREHS